MNNRNFELHSYRKNTVILDANGGQYERKIWVQEILSCLQKKKTNEQQKFLAKIKKK